MSILNRPSDGLFNVLIALIRCSVNSPSMSREKLLDLVSPPTLGDGKQDMAKKTLNTWTQLGLFETDSNDKFKVADEFRATLKKSDSNVSTVSSIVRGIVLAKRNVVNFWEEEGNRAADFSRAAAWLLAQDIYSFTPSSYRDVEKKSDDQTANGKKIFRGDVTWPGYASWGWFLGFGHPDSGKSSGGHIIDPTPAVRPLILDALPKRGEIPINELLNGLAEKLPVVDGGEYRLMIEENLRPEKWRAPGAGEISMSLSRAFLRMREAGEIRLEAKSDASASVKLIGREYKTIQSVTHVKRGDAK